MTFLPDIHATAITFRVGGPVNAALREVAIPLLALVDADGIERDPLEILYLDPEKPPTTAFKVLDISELERHGPTIMVVHHGPGTPERAQGYADIISEVWADAEKWPRPTVKFDDQELAFDASTLQDLTDRGLVRWAREGLSTRPAGQMPRGMALLPALASDTRELERPTTSEGDMLRRGVVGYASGGITPKVVPASVAADHLTVLQHMPDLAEALRDTYLLSNDVCDSVGIIEAPPPSPLKAIIAAHLLTSGDAAPVTSLSPPTGIGGPIAQRVQPTPPNPSAKRPGKEGRLVYMDASALMAGMDKDWFHPDDQVFTCTITAFHAAGSVWFTEQFDGTRETWSVNSHGHLRPIHVSEMMIYHYGGRILHMREKKMKFHPDATRYEVWATVVANYYGAVLATCFPERYKGLMPGLDIAHYQPYGNTWEYMEKQYAERNS